MRGVGKLLKLGLSLPVLINLTGLASAQESPPPIVHITRVKVDAGELDSYLKFMKEKGIPAYRRSDLQWLHAWQVWPYGEGPQFLFATEVPNFAVFDGPHPLSKVMSETELSAFQAEMAKSVESWSTMALQRLPDQSFMKENPQLKAAVLFTADFAPGMRSQALAFLKQDILPAMKKAGVEACLSHAVMFGNGPDLVIAVLQPNFASLDKGHPVVQAYGPDMARSIFARADDLFINTKVITLRFMPDLSFDKRGD